MMFRICALLSLVVGGSLALTSCGSLFLPCLLGDYETVVFVPFSESGCPETDPPENVGSLRAIGGSKQVLLTWTNPDDSDLTEVTLFWQNNSDPSDAGSYTFTPVVPNQKMTHLIEGLREATVYTFVIKTVDAFKNTKEIAELATTTALTTPPIDIDNDKLIDIYNLDMLNNIRYNLAGTSYKTSERDVGVQCTDEAGTAVDCAGYELAVALDFTTYESYALKNTDDPRKNLNDDWLPEFPDDLDRSSNTGWIPIGNGRNPFVTVFEGNANTIRNLYARGDGEVGLFGVIGKSGSAGAVRNLTVESGAVYGSSNDTDFVGVIAGRLNHGTISAVVVVDGTVNGGMGDEDYVGVLVGRNNGTINERSAVAGTSSARGGGGQEDAVGVLVGENSGTINQSSVTGTATATGEAGNKDYVGVLVGKNSGTITDGTASGTAEGGVGDQDSVGVLVGHNSNSGMIIGSSASGTAKGGVGDKDYVGVLVGWNGGEVGNSIGNNGIADGESGIENAVGALVGYNSTGGMIIGSSASGTAKGGVGNKDYVGVLVGWNGGEVGNSFVRTGTADGEAGMEDAVGVLIGLNDSTGKIHGSSAAGTAKGGIGNKDSVGILVGWNSGEVRDNSARGTINTADGGAGTEDAVGALVGWNNGTIEKNYATGTATGGADNKDYVGALVGYNYDNGKITDSYAIGDANGGAGAEDAVGALVGTNSGTITASYAVGDAMGGTGDSDAVGALVGTNSGTITASYAIGDAMGGTGDSDAVGAFVGANSGTITASYAIGDANGEAGDSDAVGALVGTNSGAITASYAAGIADGGANNNDYVGAFVGANSGTITASYATGDANGGAGDDDRVGALVGWNESGGNISQNYTTADATGDAGSDDYVGALAGENSGTIAASYAFGDANGNEQGSTPHNGNSKPSSVGTDAARLSSANTTQWVTPVSGAWHFRDGDSPPKQPALKYADYDGAGGTYKCSQFPAKVPGTETDLRCGTTLIPGQLEVASLLVDADGNKLINIESLEMLDNMRHSLDGTVYKIGLTDRGLKCGVGGTVDCEGYELMKDLDFADAGSYAGFGIRSDWRPNHTDPANATNSGWVPIGGVAKPFVTTFEGNGHSIHNLYAHGSFEMGLFGSIGRGGSVGPPVVPAVSGVVRNLTIVNGNVYGNDASWNTIGIIAAVLSSGTISNSAAIGGSASGMGGEQDRVGGLVGVNGATIVASYAAVNVDGGPGFYDVVGGLVGWNGSGSIIIASHATSNVMGGNGNGDSVGGLVGHNEAAISASYATGSANGGPGDWDSVGGLVGRNEGDVTASYATATADGGAGTLDVVGALIGAKVSGTITKAYAFGNVIGNENWWSPTRAYDTDTYPPGVLTVDQLTAGNVGDGWNDANSHTAGAWVFNDGYGAPALKYADYDGDGRGIDYCAQFPARACSTNRLLPNQPVIDQSPSGSIDDAYAIGVDFSPGVSVSIPAKLDARGDSDYFKIIVTKSGTLSVEAVKSSIDSQATLLNSAQNQIVYNDNAGVGNNFRIARPVTPGVYYIRVSSSHNYNNIGGYQLVVRLY